jgi:senataxin
VAEDLSFGSVDSFERAALGTLLWRRPGPDELTDIPTEFRDARHYVKSFEPVLLEETREEVRSAWLESLGERRQYPLRMQTLEAAGEAGWKKATLVCDDRRDAEAIRALCPEHSVVVLCERRIDEQDPWPRAVDGHELPLAVAGFIEKVTMQEGFVEVRLFLSNDAGAATNSGAPGWQPWHESLRQRERAVLEAFEGVRRPVTDHTGRRERTSAAAAEEGEVEAAPPREAAGRLWVLAPAGKLSSAAQAYEALHHFQRLHAPMRAAMLKPPKEGMPRVLGVPPPPLADEIASHPEFVAFLAKNFNDPQLAAIKWSAAHTLRSYEYDGGGGGGSGELAAAAAAAAGEAVAPGIATHGNETEAGALTAASGEPFPFTLVQGPPGTGKTHTVWGILNILHLVLYQRYFQHLHRAITLGTARATGNYSAAILAEQAAWLNAGAGEDEVPSETVRDLFDNLKRVAGIERGLNYGVSKPRILVCAPSNAAIDNLLERVMSRGFQSLDAGTYRPDILRVGATDAMVADKVLGVYAGGKVEGLMRMSPQEWNEGYIKQMRFVKEAASLIDYHEKQHAHAANAANAARVAVHGEGEDPADLP